MTFKKILIGMQDGLRAGSLVLSARAQADSQELILLTPSSVSVSSLVAPNRGSKLYLLCDRSTFLTL